MSRTGTALAIAVAALAAILPGAASAASGGPNGKIVFTSTRDGVGVTPSQPRATSELYVMNPDGSGQRRLTDNLVGERDPVWSPDGTRIAFGAPDGLYVMDATGGGTTRLVAVEDALTPSWSPDGRSIVFATGAAEIRVVRADGSGAAKIADGSDPAWSPLGDAIAFRPPGVFQLWLMDPDGTDPRFVAEAPGARFAWSPDGTRIAGDGPRATPGDGTELWVVHVSGADPRRLTTCNSATTDVFCGDPSWAPDGSRIAFSETTTEGPIGIFTIRPDGTGLTTLSSRGDAEPDWQRLPAGPAPDCSAVRPSTSALRPPNHKFREVVLLLGRHAGAPELTITAVTQDEPVGRYQDAWLGRDSRTVWLRAERHGRDGRVYRISFSLEDASGRTCAGTVTVSVPKSARPAVDSGPRHDSFTGLHP